MAAREQDEAFSRFSFLKVQSNNLVHRPHSPPMEAYCGFFGGILEALYRHFIICLLKENQR